MPPNLNTSTAWLFQYFKSLTWVQAKLSAFTACCQAALSLSNETPKMAKFLSLNWRYAFNTFGFSILQGSHQLAQKSTSKYLPRNEAIGIFFPETSGNDKSGQFL